MSTRVKYRPVGTTAEELINTQDDWILLQVKKEGAGQVVIGENQELLPVDSGRGIEILQDTWTTLLLEPGTIFYVAAPAAEKISLVSQVIPKGFFEMPALLQRAVFALERLASAAGAPAPTITPKPLTTTQLRRGR